MNLSRCPSPLVAGALRVCLVLFALRSSHYIDVCVAGTFLELNSSVNESVKSVVFTHAYVCARTVNSTALTADDVASLSELTTENFNAESLAFRLTAVLRTTYTFLMCHNLLKF